MWLYFYLSMVVNVTYKQHNDLKLQVRDAALNTVPSAHYTDIAQWRGGVSGAQKKKHEWKYKGFK